MMIEDARSGYRVTGVIFTAEPPCFAYPVFQNSLDDNRQYVQISDRSHIVDFKEIHGYEVVGVDPGLIVDVGSDCVFGFVASAGDVIVGLKSDLASYFRRALNESGLDNFPALKHRIEVAFFGIDSEDTRRQILDSYSLSTPKSLEYYFINDVFRTAVERRLDPELLEVFHNTRIKREDSDITLEFPEHVKEETRHLVSRGASEAFAATPLLNVFRIDRIQQDRLAKSRTAWL